MKVSWWAYSSSLAASDVFANFIAHTLAKYAFGWCYIYNNAICVSKHFFSVATDTKKSASHCSSFYYKDTYILSYVSKRIFTNIHRACKWCLSQTGYKRLVNWVFRFSKMSYEVCCPGIKPQSTEKNCVKDWKSFCTAKVSCSPESHTVLQICNALVLFIAFLHIQLSKLNFASISVNGTSVIFTECHLLKALQVFFYFIRL